MLRSPEEIGQRLGSRRSTAGDRRGRCSAVATLEAFRPRCASG